ncbi:MAG: MmgE/PrpD family protein, partial [Bacteroidota bacterium]
EADHSLPYMLAVAILDDGVMPAQYLPERIMRSDVQELLRKVNIRPLDEFSRRFPAEMPCRIRITLKDGRAFTTEKRDYEGFLTRPMPWEGAIRKFEALTRDRIPVGLAHQIEDAVAHLETIQVSELTGLLARA